MIRNLRLSDLNQINVFLIKMKVKKLTKKDLENNLHCYVVYEIDKRVVGFLGYSIYYDRAELDYIYVEENYRQQLIGKQLLNFLFEQCKTCYNISLEVRSSNTKAINFYQNNGFIIVRTIEKYYQNEDGVLMVKELD